TDGALMSRFALEDPYTERLYQLRGDSLIRRAAQFVNPPFNNYLYVEEPRRDVAWQGAIASPYVRMYGYRFNSVTRTVASPMEIEGVPRPTSTFAVTWRGIRRPHDRENGIA